MVRSTYDRARTPAFAAVTAACLALLAAVPAAEAHGLGSEDPNRPVGEYLWLGIKHLLAGWDHLLFILAIVLVAGSLWRAAKLMSVFVLGHSITLALATFQEWKVSTTFVDIVIALSVVAVAVIGLRGRPSDWRPFAAGLFAFGLVHGLGLSTRLQALGVSDDSLGLRVLLFNIGIEIGQAVAVIAFFGIGWAVARYWGKPVRPVRPAFGVIALAGLVGAAVISFTAAEESSGERQAGPTGQTRKQEGAARSACRERTATPAVAAPGGGHPERSFYAPGETYPADDFGHVLGDGYIVVTYRAGLPAADVERLRAEVEGGQEGLLAGAVGDQEHAIVATTVRRELRCRELDVDALSEFRDSWIEEITGQQ